MGNNQQPYVYVPGSLYDTRNEMKSFTESLFRLNQLIHMRLEAGYIRHERMNEWVVLGRWVTDSCGNFGKISGDFIPAEKIPDLPPIMTMGELWAQIKFAGLDPDRCNLQWGMNSEVPPENIVCPECGKPWTIYDCHDTVVRRHADVWEHYHHTCNRAKVSRVAQAEFAKVFEDAGYGKVLLTAVPNQYCQCDYCAPWFEIQTAAGEIVIGWRKRVINIQVSVGFRVGLEALFADEDVTKGRNYIHAWGYDKATEYLRIIKRSSVRIP